MNEDNRGVERGPCRVEDCDCGQFASNQINKNDYSCQYCGCPPSKHESLMNKKQQTKSTIRTSVKDGLDLRQKMRVGPAQLVPQSKQILPVIHPNSVTKRSQEMQM